MPKSYNHLYEKYISDDNIELAIKSASKGKKKRKNVCKKLSNQKFKDEIKIYAANFKNAVHIPKEIYDGVQRKKRKIIVPTFEEQVIHHMVVNVLKPIFMKGMYLHSYGSIPKRGPHKGKKQITKWIKNGKTKDFKYCFKGDIRKYFDSIPHNTLINKLKRIIHDEKFMSVIVEIIEVVPIGLPLGFYTSQWLGNWYLQDFDHYIKECLHIKYYIRYMDDIVLFNSNKKYLHWIKNTISIYLSSIGLLLKQNWQVFKFDYNGKYRFLDFMGFRFYRNRVTLRRTILIKAFRKANKIHKTKKLTIYSARQMLSYLGWIDCTNVYGFYIKYIKPLVNFQKLKNKVSRYDKNYLHPKAA